MKKKDLGKNKALVPAGSSFLIYTTEDGKTRIQVKLQDETVWLTQAHLCELFDKDKRTISEHIRNIFAESELIEETVVRNFRITAADGKNYNTKALAEYDKFRQAHLDDPSPVERHFIEAVKEVKFIEKAVKKSKKKGGNESVTDHYRLKNKVSESKKDGNAGK